MNTATMSVNEKTPLLQSGAIEHIVRDDSSGCHGDISRSQRRASTTSDVRLERHITMWHAVLIIVGSVIGSGIFVSPKGVVDHMNSVGGSLIIWTVTGLINLCQALCYAELGGIIPKAGGDYAYLFYILGPLPAFLGAWIHILILSASSCGVIAHTAGLYLMEYISLDCRDDVITLIAALIIVSLAVINVRSAVWGKRVHIMFTVAKVTALLIVIIAGVTLLTQGHTDNFKNSFAGSSRDPGAIALGILDGYFAYKGWELVNALPEEMINPTRDLQPAVVIAMVTVTGIYVLTNMAYFTVLTPAQLLSSDAVALTFADSALGWMAGVMPVAVSLSCMGAVNGDFLCNSRYLFAGGRFRQVPRVFSFIHVTWLTPILAIIALCILALMYCILTDLQVLQEYASLSGQMKNILVLVALFYARWKLPDIPRPFKMNTVLAVVTLLVTATLVVLSFYQSPIPTAVGFGIFLFGIPVYFLGRVCLRSTSSGTCMNKVTLCLQKVFKIVPETSHGSIDHSEVHTD